jgi:uncharacterized peroxidase-related enzyme
MAFIESISDEAASEEVTALFDVDRERLGYVANYTRIFGHRPAVERARRQLLAAITENMDPRRYELATVAAARRLRSSYCMLAHGKILAEEHLSPTVVGDLAVDPHAAELDEVDVAVMDFAGKVVDDATSVIPSDIARLRELGLSDVEILDIALAAAVRCFVSKTIDALCVTPDTVFGELDPDLRRKLTVGRSLAAG